MSISIESLKEAILVKEQISELEARLVKILGAVDGTGPIPIASLKSEKPTVKKPKTMSTAARAKIAAAQKARWAKQKETPIAAATSSKTKRKLSAEGRAKIVAALKKRWAATKKN